MRLARTQTNTAVRRAILGSGTARYSRRSPMPPALTPELALRASSGVRAGGLGLRREYRAVPLPKIARRTAVFVCVLASLILLLSGYLGYAGVALAVALAAGINLL